MDKRAERNMILAMVMFGTIGLFRRGIDLPSGVIAMTRGILACLFLLAVMRLGKTPVDRAAVKRNLPALLVSGGIMGLNWALLFESYNHTTLATATLCYYMAPVFMILLSAPVLGEKLTPRKLACTAAAVFGMVLVSGILEGGTQGGGDALGILFGLGAAVLYALVILINKKVEGVASMPRTTVQLGAAAIAALPYVLATTDVSTLHLTVKSAVLLLIVCFVLTGLAYTMYFGSLEHVSAQKTALLSYIDPIVALLLGTLLLHEPMTPLAAAGAVLVLGSAALAG